MIDTTPLMSLSTFFIGFFIVTLLAVLIFEIFDNQHIRKSSQDAATSSEQYRTANPAVQRYYTKYSTKRKGA